VKELYTAFIAAQAEFSALKKDATNPHFKMQYATLAAALDAVLPALNKHGLGVFQKTTPEDKGVRVETYFIHTSGEQLMAGELYLPAVKADPQGFGSALTYARRYSLMAACGIAPEDDDANSATEAVKAHQSKPPQKAEPATTEKPKPKAPLTSAQAKEIVAAFKIEAKEAKTLEKLHKSSRETWKQVAANLEERDEVTKIFEEYKAFLSTPFDEA
jgi:hypothetical protein